MTATATDFVPADLDATRWEALEPFYRALVDREVTDAAGLEALLLDRSELDAATNEAHAILYIAMTCDTENEEKKQAYLAFVENVEPNLRTISFELDRKIASHPAAGALDEDRYGVLLRDLRADVELFRDENVPLFVEDTRLGQRYAELCGRMTVVWKGEERPLPRMNPLLEETDRAVREEAWRLVSDRRLADRDAMDGLLDEMVRLRTRIARNAGLASYRDYAFRSKHRFDYTPHDCEAYHRAAEECFVPILRRLGRARAEALGIERLRPWDLAVDPQGRAPLRPFADAAELVAKTSGLFHDLDADLGRLFDGLDDGDSLDLESRKGKAPGGYQENRDRQRRPFIFMNAAGTQGDVDTMIHEAGHAFHSMLAKDEPLVHYRHAPIEFAEIASMGMELLAQPYLGRFYAEEEAARARRTHLEGIVRTIPWVATIDAFQHWMYTHPEHDRSQRTRTWLELGERLGQDVDWTDLEGAQESAWQRQLHIFEVPFYYIEYGIAQLGALQLWLRSRKDPAGALAAYRRALALGGSKPLPALFEAADLVFDFGPDTVRRLADAVEDAIEALPA